MGLEPDSKGFWGILGDSEGFWGIHTAAFNERRRLQLHQLTSESSYHLYDWELAGF